MYRRAFSTQRLPLFPAPYTKWKRNNLYRVYNYLFGFIFCHINCLKTFKKVIFNFNHLLFILALVSSHRREVRYYRNKIMSIQGYKHTQRDITVQVSRSRGSARCVGPAMTSNTRESGVQTTTVHAVTTRTVQRIECYSVVYTDN